MLFGSDHWHKRAEEARCIAEQMSTDSSRTSMLRVADNYDLLARQAEHDEKG